MEFKLGLTLEQLLFVVECTPPNTNKIGKFQHYTLHCYWAGNKCDDGHCISNV